MANINSYSENLAKLTEAASEMLEVAAAVNETIAGNDAEVVVNDDVTFPSYQNVLNSLITVRSDDPDVKFECKADSGKLLDSGLNDSGNAITVTAGEGFYWMGNVDDAEDHVSIVLTKNNAIVGYAVVKISATNETPIDITETISKKRL